MTNDKQACKVFCGGLSWETSSERLRAYFENFGVVREAFVSYNRNNGRPRGFGFVVFESSEVADKVVATKHTIDRREVECKRAVPKEEQPASSPPSSNEGGPAQGAAGSNAGAQRTRKIFVGGLAPAVDNEMLKKHFEQFGAVEDAVVMYDHDNKRPRGFGFVTFAAEESVDKVFGRGVMQTILDKQIEIKPAVPRDQMPAAPPMGRPVFWDGPRGGFGGPRGPPDYMHHHNPYHSGYRGYGPRGAYHMGPGPMGPPGGRGPRGYGPGGYGAAPMGNIYGGPGAMGRGAGYGGPKPTPAPHMGAATSMGAHSYDLYGAGLPNGSAGMFAGSNAAQAQAQALYANLASLQPHLNGMQGGATGKINPFNPNSINLKTLGALASTFGANFPNTQQEGYSNDASAAYAAANQEAAEAALAAEAAAAAVNAAAGGLPVGVDFNGLHDAGFAGSPAPGWSS